MNFFEKFSKLSDKDKKEVLDIMKYKRNLENEELKKRLKKYEDPEDLTLMFMYCDLKAKDTIKELQEEIEKLENVIVGLECDIKVLQEQIEDDCKAHEEANKWCKEAHELAIENKELKDKINKAIEYIKQCDEYEDCCNGDEIIWILRGE